jgi:quercetin dioxygenase-like cupin family protein
MSMTALSAGDYPSLKLKLDGMVKPRQPYQFHRNLLFDQLYASLPRDPQVKVQIYNAEIVPGGYTNWHCHNGAAFFVVLQGQFEAHFQEGVLVKAKAGECYSEPIAKFHRGHNPHPTLSYCCIGMCLTAPDRDHVTNSIARPW